MWGVKFHEKSNLEKKLWFPENSKFFEIPNFRQNSPKLVTPWRKFPGIRVLGTPQNTRIYGFLGILELKSRFFPGNFHENSKFSRHFGVTRHEIPGNFGRKNPGKCRNIRVSRVFGGKNHNFPGNFGRPVEISWKSGRTPQACTFKNIRVSRSPQAHILTPKKDPQKFICT